MKNCRVPLLFALCWLAAFFLRPGSVSAYDSPDFEFKVFSADGIFLPAEQRSSLLEALAATASNFTGNPRVDDDLREKALSVALRLDPMHYNSRLAHRGLANGTAPAATAYFDSLTVVSETLWNLAKQLAGPPLQPEGIRLAPYLMELSLITHPEPPTERLEFYADTTDGNYPLWERFTILQPDGNRSTTRTLSIRSETNSILALRKRSGTKDSTPGAGTAPALVKPEPQPPEPGISASVATSLTVVSSIVEIDGTPMAGRVSLMLRPPQNRIERDLIAAAGSSTSGPDGQNLPLIASNEDIPVGEIRIPSTFATERSWIWPAGAVGEVAFTPSGRSPSMRPATVPNVMPQAVVLVGNLLGKTSINEEFVLSGETNDPASAPVIRDPLLTVEAAGSFRKKYLLVPASALEALVASLQQTGQLALLFQTELISYSSLTEALELATSPTDTALVEASTAFDEIEAVSTRMSFPELSRNAKVQERLEAILTKYPHHLSARAMLEYGRLPLTQEMKISEFTGQLGALLEPFLHLEGAENLENAKGKMVDADQQLARLRIEAPAEVRDLIPPAANLLAAAANYLSLPAGDTANARQHLDDVARYLAQLKSGFSTLGIPSSFAALAGTSPIILEGETLVENAEVTGGRASVQKLGDNGSIFSEDSHLWWTEASPGDTCSIRINGLEPGTRTVSLSMTTARDYGIARISIGNLYKEIDFYSRDILVTDPLVFENIELDPGESLAITFQIIGTNPNAEPRFYLGIDRIEVR